MRAFLQALAFLTVLPTPRRDVVGEGPRPWAAACFPAVGAVLGVALLTLHDLLGRVLPPPVGAALTVAAWVGVTGALHLDGLMDSADALLGSRAPEERLRILKDPGIGAFGVAAGSLVLLTKVGALASLTGGARAAILLAPTLARWSAVMTMAAFPYHRRPGVTTGGTLTARLGGRQVAVASLLPLLAAPLAGPPALLGLLLGGGVALAVGRYASRRLPALTGDIYGAIIELVEALTLCLFSGTFSH